MLAAYVVLVLGSVALIDGKLPDYVVPCSASSPTLNACAKEHGINAIPFLLKGEKQHHLPSLVPLNLEKVEIKSSNNFDLILTKLKIFGIEKVELKDITIDPVKKHFVVDVFVDDIKIFSDYKVNGKILVLPISGEGKADFQFTGCNFHYTLDLDVVKGFASIKNADIIFKIAGAKFHLDNLFEGNKQLGDETNKVLNENPQEVIKDLGGAISEVIKTIINNILNSYITTTPFAEILLP